jgi:hypothetical protein
MAHMEEAMAMAKPAVMVLHWAPAAPGSCAKTGDATHKTASVTSKKAENRLTIFSPFIEDSTRWVAMKCCLEVVLENPSYIPSSHKQQKNSD